MAGMLEGRVAIITGAASPIGAAIAERFRREGAQLVLSDIEGEKLSALPSALLSDALAMPADLSQEAEARSVVDAALARFGKIDILVNNAGGGIIRAFLEHTPDSLKATIDRNLWTTLWCSWLAIPHMKARGYGRIVNIGADSVRNGLWLHAGYNAAKGGVHALATGLAREFAQDGITVNVVAPCIVETPGVTAARATSASGMIEKMTGVVPIGRAARMEEVASMTCYLASEEASFVTGQVVSVNGGSTML
ncbi:MAG: SDR family oxidoreductase [Hyphomicrobiales bacterium]|nr:SDR family oxidoreductase [Hyphomicrobiales bacterium]